ncbi:DNA internalization-related competence protein ComEC/Rec2 [Caldalkalibacillus salinus]|uniref:DNA internalization-related competence protein ComEC/Rec2 n=1 Tax=Caldalkalibacillus salinus TaxID=2803787 RepID=UPI001923C2E4|nr:DNA internalization-related competence protein ComEC/Rec2 [Caldalkalibacillus salinus]
MKHIVTYFVLLLTLQTVLTLQGAPQGWLYLIWGSFFIMLFMNRDRLSLPQDHPQAAMRKQAIYWALVLLFVLILNQAHLSTFLYTHEQSKAHALSTDAADETRKISGKIVSTPTTDGNRIQFDLDIHQVDGVQRAPQETMRMTRYADTENELQLAEQLARGDMFTSHILIQEPSTARNPGGFDYRSFLEQQNIFSIGTVVDAGWQAYSQPNIIDSSRQKIDVIRSLWQQQVEQVFSADLAPIVLAMTVGDRSLLDPHMVTMYQELGIIHILAISGLHVGIIVWGMYRLLLWLPLTRESVIHVLIIFIPLYILLSGAQPSVVRAGLMAMLALLLLRFGVWKHSLLALYTVYSLTLFFSPFSIYHIGYQLSYFITFCLISGYPVLEKAMREWRIKEGFKQLLGISLIAQIASLPIVIYQFYQFSPLSLFINLVVVPIYSIVFIPASFVLTLLTFLSQPAVQLYVVLFERLHAVVLSIVDSVYNLPFATLYLGQPSGWWFGLFIGLLLLWFIQLEKGHMWKAGLCLMGFPILIMVQILLPYMDARAHIMMLDVGQGDAIVIELPYRQEVVMIDLGGQMQFPREEWQNRASTFEVGKDIVLPYLQYRGIQKIDKVITSHGHFDHMGGVQGLIGQVAIKGWYRPPVAGQSTFEKEWLDRIVAEGIPIYTLREGDAWQTGTSRSQVLFPERDAQWMESMDNLHDYNIVLWQDIYGVSFLWTGDVEEAGETHIMKAHPKLDVDILKVAHHGSETSTSSSFIAHVRPLIGLISVGENNRYGHPHQDVLQRLAEAEVSIFRTDDHGGIYIQLKPHERSIHPTVQPVPLHSYEESIQ